MQARGPNAREERKREEAMAQRVRSLDKVTKELLTTAAAWEEAKGAPLVYGGERFIDRVAAQDEHYADVRDGLRNARKKGAAGAPTNGKAGGGAGAPAAAKKPAPAPAAKAAAKHEAAPALAHAQVHVSEPVNISSLPPRPPVNDENQRTSHRNASMGSIETDFTSATSVTELKQARPAAAQTPAASVAGRN